MTALSPEQRSRYDDLTRRLRQSQDGLKELTNGYAVRYPSGDETLLNVAEFVTLERRCCPFLAFAVEVEREGGPAWLRMTGRSGTKDFLRMEFNLG